MTDGGPRGRRFRVVRMYSNEAGHTVFADLQVPGPEVSFDGSDRAHAVRDMPATTINIIELLDWRPRLDLHPPPRRQWVVILQGAMEISTTSGQRRRFEPGDCLLAEDLHGYGHCTDDVGEDRLVTMNIGAPDDWIWPASSPS